MKQKEIELSEKNIMLKPGDCILDVGGGWGAFTEHAGRRGIQVTSLAELPSRLSLVIRGNQVTLLQNGDTFSL